MAENVSIRVAVFPQDLEIVRTLFRNYAAYLGAQPSGAANICITGLEKELASLPAPYQTVLLAEVDGQAAGCVALKPLSLPHENAVEIKRLWIEPSKRGLKLGKKLFSEAILSSKNAHFTAIYLDTVPAAMPEANRMYAQLKFEEVPRYNQNDVAGVVFFRLDLSKQVFK